MNEATESTHQRPATSAGGPSLTVGVEEEFLLVDGQTSELVPRCREVLQLAESVLGEEVGPELNLCEIEVATPICTNIDQVEANLTRLRSSLVDVADPLGLAAVGLGSHPFSTWEEQRIDDQIARFNEIRKEYRLIAREQVIAGCHVHVGVHDPDLAVQVSTRMRPWLGPLLALSANSPYWESLDSGYDSYRMQVWQRWPTAGMPPELHDRAGFDNIVAELVDSCVIADSTYLYWYVRPSHNYPTVETRVCDVCLTAEETAALAGLIRALVWRCLDEIEIGATPSTFSDQVLEAMAWRASRHGLSEELVSPLSGEPIPAATAVQETLDWASPGLEAMGDTERVHQTVGRILQDGNGATRQRRAMAARGGDPTGVVSMARQVAAGPLSPADPHHIVNRGRSGRSPSP